MKVIKLFALILTASPAFAQLNVKKVSKIDVPSSVHYSGKVLEAFRYTDYNGEYLTFITETGIVKPKGQSPNEDYKGADLYAFNYKIEGNQFTLVWKIHDLVSDCSLDITAEFVLNTFAVTDLNKDGKAEVWVMYRTTCRGDVSAPAMKIIMYENGKKYAIRGEAKVLVGTAPVQYDGGKYTLDPAFKSGPSEFKQYAEALWQKNIMTK